MKKSTLALAVAAALIGSTAAYADTTLYGSARVSVDYVDDGTANPFSSGSNSDSYWDVYNNASRLGVRGEEDLGGGLRAIYQYEFGVDVTEGGNLESNRPKFVGLKGGFGSVTAGTQWTPYYNVIGIGDIFNSSRSFATDSYLGYAYGRRMDNSLIYTTPNFSGFSAQAMLVMNGSCAPQDPNTPSQLCKMYSTNLLPSNLSDGVDMWNLSASYKNGPFFAGATYMALEGPSFGDFVTAPTYDGEQWGLAFGYNQGPFSASLSYEDGDVNNLYIGKSQNIYLTGQYTFGNNVVRAAYGFVSPDDNNIAVVSNGVVGVIQQEDINNYLLGYQYNFSKRTRVWVEYLGRTSDGYYEDKNVVSIGTRHDF